MKTIKPRPIKYDFVEFMRLAHEAAQIERKVRKGLWPNSPIASDGDRYMTHGDLAQVLGLWNGKDWNRNRFRVTDVLTLIYDRAAEIAPQCGDIDAAFGRTFRNAKGERGAGAHDEIKVVITRP
jgi:hypothetical protein